MAFTIKRGDLLPLYRAQLTYTDPETAVVTPVDLTGAASVKFIMSAVTPPGGIAKVSAAAAFVDRPTGIVEYTWIAADTNLAGSYNVEFEVTWTTGTKPQTFPAAGYLSCDVVADLG